MTPDQAFDGWRTDFAARSRSVACQWSRLTEALGRLVLHNSLGVHGRVVLARLNDLEGIISDLRLALRGYGEETAQRLGESARLEREASSNTLWSHLEPEVDLGKSAESDGFTHVQRLLLEQTIERYMRNPWLANDVLEWMMIDASVYEEVASFGKSNKRYFKAVSDDRLTRERGSGARRMTLRAVGLLGELSAFVAAPIAAAVLAPIYITDRAVLWIPPIALLCLVAYTIVAMARLQRRSRRKQAAGRTMSQWAHMCAAYRSLERPIASLAHVKEVLRRAAAAGARWSRHTYALLEYAEARGARTWNV